VTPLLKANTKYMKPLFLIKVILIISSMNAYAQYEYFDGNGNGYIISADAIKYIPVTPERSSSGRYSGGQPKTVFVKPEQYALVKKLLDAAIEKEEVHQADRAMMTGLILRITSSDTTRVVLNPKAAEKSRIEEALRQLLTNP
jgi:hypothetical protein